MKSKLNKQQKKYIKACDCKELRKELKRFLKKENKSFNKKSEKHIKQRDKIANKILINGLVWEPLIVLDEAKREEFEKINGKGFPWYKESLKEVEERFKEATKKYMPNPNEKIKYEFVQSSNGKIGFPSKNSITKETLESLTNPDLTEKKKDFENAIEEPFKNLEFDLPKTSQKLDELINAIKLTYSREDMFKCFYESRLTNPIVGFKFDSFASYIEYLQK